MGDDKPLTRQQFQALLERLDRVYESYEDLTGSKPAFGEVIFVFLRNFGEKDIAAGNAHRSSITININTNHPNFAGDRLGRRPFFESIHSNGTPGILLHEMAHTFATHRGWEITPEMAAEILTACAMESLDTHCHQSYNSDGAPSITRGSKHRKQIFDLATRSARDGSIMPFPSTLHFPAEGPQAVYNRKTVCAFYLFGLVDVVGWDAYKQAFRSYSDSDFIPLYLYQCQNPDASPNQKRPHERARDLIDRIAHFSGKPDALRLLPDRGEMLQLYLPVVKLHMEQLQLCPDEAMYFLGWFAKRYNERQEQLRGSSNAPSGRVSTPANRR